MVILEIHNMTLKLEITSHKFVAFYVTKQVDKGLPVDVVYFDFSKAFDEVAHNRLINKIKTWNFSLLLPGPRAGSETDVSEWLLMAICLIGSPC